jgi:hypothetical protein
MRRRHVPKYYNAEWSVALEDGQHTLTYKFQIPGLYTLWFDGAIIFKERLLTAREIYAFDYHGHRFQVRGTAFRGFILLMDGAEVPYAEA